ncbi:MAG: class I SAM-dependent methyltransferase [Methanobacteriota archaeon]|nr:MAG: class I SAM-dependent methyltransferase [Euryarchaeota archaeon]
MEDKEFDAMAQVYDSMIDWERRLERELPFLISRLKPANRVLEVACSTGRHTAALACEFDVVGVDINQQMILKANENVQGTEKQVTLIHGNILDQSSEDLGTFEGGIILANTLANMESRSGVKKCLEKLRELIPSGRLIGQTVQLGTEIVYLPLRSCTIDGEAYLVQRLIIPISIGESTHQLHFNVFKDGKYVSQSVHSLYSISLPLLKELASQTGWNLVEIYGGYDESPPRDRLGGALVWVLE